MWSPCVGKPYEGDFMRAQVNLLFSHGGVFEVVVAQDALRAHPYYALVVKYNPLFSKNSLQQRLLVTSAVLRIRGLRVNRKFVPLIG